MNITVLTIFPELFEPFWAHGIIRRAIEKDKVTASAINIRDFAEGRHLVTDDRPYGGGCGMVMKPEPLARSVEYIKTSYPKSKIILLTPQGRPFNQRVACDLAMEEEIALVCGRYEGVDERFYQNYADDELSIGDFVLTGGEVAAMIIIDAVTRLVPGVLGGAESAQKDSFSDGLLEHAHYTRPPDFEGDGVPDVLLSGNHGKIDKWRMENSLIRTFLKRPDLLNNRSLNDQEADILRKWCRHIERILNAQAVHCVNAPSGDE